jgi:NADPH:quinone reductase
MANQKMTFIKTKGYGPPEGLVPDTCAIPEPGFGEILIKVEAAGVNRPDVLQRTGNYPPPPGASDVLGLEVAGTVVALGDGISDWKVGNKVCALVASGGYAEYCVAPAPQCLPVPKSFSMVEAAGLPETFFTVWTNVLERGKLQKGETVLIHGGSSGIGTTAIQLAHVFGAKVFTTAGTDEKCVFCENLGAEKAINYRVKNFVTEVKALTEGRGVDLILDMVGGAVYREKHRCPGHGRPIGADRFSAGEPRFGRFSADDAETADADGIDFASPHGGTKRQHCQGLEREGVAPAGRRDRQACHPCNLST